jgi:hypothetical protein
MQEIRMTTDDPFSAPRKLTHEQARIEHLRYWSTKTVEERLAGMTALNREVLIKKGLDPDKVEWDWNPRMVTRERP